MKFSTKVFTICLIISSICLVFAYFLQHQGNLEPCPLCILQRIGMALIGVISLLALIHRPQLIGQRIYSGILFLVCGGSAAIAGRHVWIQHLPSDQVPECGPGLGYILDNFPISEAFSIILKGSGDCAQVVWKFLGLSIPEWTLIVFVGLGLMAFWALIKANKAG